MRQGPRTHALTSADRDFYFIEPLINLEKNYPLEISFSDETGPRKATEQCLKITLTQNVTVHPVKTSS